MDKTTQKSNTMNLLDKIFEIEDEQVVQENRRSDTAPACKICMDGDITMVLLPCRHLLCCVRCAEQLKKCPKEMFNTRNP